MDLELDNQQNINRPVFMNVQREVNQGFSFTRLFIKLGLAKDESGANMMALVFTIVFFLVTIGVFLYFRGTFSSYQPPAAVDRFENLPQWKKDKIPQNVRDTINRTKPAKQ